jgi:hypothetical protein
VVERSAELLDAADVPAGHDVVAEFVARLTPESWGDLGGHPLLLLLRDDGSDEGIQRLRLQALERAIERLDPQDEAGRLRAQLVLALFYGTVALRETARLEPLASADPQALEGALDDAVAALLRRP